MKIVYTEVTNKAQISAITPVQHCIEFSSVNTIWRNCNKDICLGNKEKNLPIFAEIIFVYLENPKEKSTDENFGNEYFNLAISSDKRPLYNDLMIYQK